jgi:hypothetical protein
VDVNTTLDVYLDPDQNREMVDSTPSLSLHQEPDGGKTKASVPLAIRYLWYDTPCTNYPYQCPIYTTAPPVGQLAAESLPLGPFVMPLID